jgi:hypothetical protein
MPYPVLAAARKRVVRRLESGDAFSPESALELEGLSRVEHGRLARLLAYGAIRETEPGRYWLDVPRYANYLGHVRRIVILTLIAVLIALFFVVELSGRP